MLIYIYNIPSENIPTWYNVQGFRLNDHTDSLGENNSDTALLKKHLVPTSCA